MLSMLPGHVQSVQAVPQFAEALRRRLGARAVIRSFSVTTPMAASAAPYLVRVFLEEDKGPDHDVPAASGVRGRGRIDTGSMKRPA